MKIKDRQLLSASHSSKKTFHISLDICGIPLSYKEGDAIAIFPHNPTWMVVDILNLLNAQGSELVCDPKTQMLLPIGSYLHQKANLSRITSAQLSYIAGYSSKKELISTLLDQENKSQKINYLQSHDLLSVLQDLQPSPLNLQEFVHYLPPMLPRFYSIASSPVSSAGQLDLLVATFSYLVQNSTRTGVGSDFLCYQAEPTSTSISAYIQHNPNFALPDPTTPIIMIGAGTGVAPYRAFLQKRYMDSNPSLNWLFFGERNQAHDFYYKQEFSDYMQKGLLKLTTAFSRDQATKCYVQHKMLEHRKDLWEWIRQGAVIYLCGDAKQMAKDVQATLLLIFEEQGNLSKDQAKTLLQQLKKDNRYQIDVY